MHKHRYFQIVKEFVMSIIETDTILCAFLEQVSASEKEVLCAIEIE